jgi:acyl-CoA thioester hydrolase
MVDNTKPFSEASLRVRFAETDAMGIVHHASYLLYFEVGRVELTRQAGASYGELEAGGHSLAVSGVEVRYMATAHFDQMLTVRTQVKDIRSRSITLTYEILDADTGQLLASGTTRHVCVDHKGVVKRIPQPWLEAVQSFATPQ